MDPVLFAIFFLTCAGAGATGAAFPPGKWYETLRKPNWTPPNWVFPVAWTSIYILISFAGARVASLEGSAYAMAFWAGQAAFIHNKATSSPRWAVYPCSSRAG